MTIISGSSWQICNIVTENLDLETPIRSEAIIDFFKAFSQLDVHQHNREEILEMDDQIWYLRMFDTVFALTVVNAYLGYS